MKERMSSTAARRLVLDRAVIEQHQGARDRAVRGVELTELVEALGVGQVQELELAIGAAADRGIGEELLEEPALRHVVGGRRGRRRQGAQRGAALQGRAARQPWSSAR
jgi:hypothetical protein